MIIQFDTAKQYASYLSTAWGRSHVVSLNKDTLERRLESIKNYSERYARDIYGDDQLPFGYSPASYGLWWVVSSGRVNGTVYGALRAMTVRQLCELVHLLLVECGDTTSDYARFLMERYQEAA
jgi:hypothetical protein